MNENITGKRLRTLRLDKGLSQDEVAKIIGVGRTTYSKYESGDNKPVRKLKELSELFNVSTDYLLGNEKAPDTHPDLPPLTPRDERDIAKDLEKMLAELDTSAAFGGNLTPDGEDLELLKSSLTQAMTLAKRVAKQKFTPKKYRKE
ncbi:MAG: helix-turn-helix transcriptional regulator [Anaerovibrio sp.]|uniref:helix-turn-helix domain-containing protein n=1 Tax=Anaerovibrio sp. TaxID=1872532 RepID=UPI0026181DA6|nr:helix-turn-helix transcriptional regulator [Anaerovibrio sp.]MDD7676928.1 helix-turn-helix transcriptional regulator [Anaerovibrio sp.]MDY2603192.1 helix-turn-helix transcriptional regulator [Anaerovibrio sp.]